MLDRLALAAALLLPAAALAQELRPPEPGLVVVYHYGGALRFVDTMRVVAVNGLESRAEASRTGDQNLKWTLHSYRVWLSRRTIQEAGTTVQDTPAGMLDDFATLRVGTKRIANAKVRYEPNPERPTLPGDRPNRAWDIDVTMAFEVERQERVRVPAGEFDAFVLKRTQEIAAAPGRDARRDVSRIWYAPALRWWVKIEQVGEVPPRAAVVGEAVEIRRP